VKVFLFSLLIQIPWGIAVDFLALLETPVDSQFVERLSSLRFTFWRSFHMLGQLFLPLFRVDFRDQAVLLVLTASDAPHFLVRCLLFSVLNHPLS
jgi:hypothetical protein